MNNCKCCGRKEELRLGFCFDCAECESVIADGTDMYDKSIPILPGMSTAMSKLHYILSKFSKVEPTPPKTEQT